MGAKQELKQEAAAVVVPYAEKMMFAPKRFKKICVFCGSSSGKKGVFSNEALDLGRELVCIAAFVLSFFSLSSYHSNVVVSC